MFGFAAAKPGRLRPPGKSLRICRHGIITSKDFLAKVKENDVLLGILADSFQIIARVKEERLMQIAVGDILVMKKNHPCGENRFLVLRIGMYFKLRCLGCGREIMVPRSKAEKSVRRIEQNGGD